MIVYICTTVCVSHQHAYKRISYDEGMRENPNLYLHVATTVSHITSANIAISIQAFSTEFLLMRE